MKINRSALALIACLLGFSVIISAQNDPDTKKTSDSKAEIDTTKAPIIKTYLITTVDGNEFFGPITYQDEKEVVIETKNTGKVSIPKYQIKEMKETSADVISNPGERFASRYFITTNGLPIKKGDNYILWSWYGPDIQLSITDHLGVGVMTSWVGIPIIGTVKYSFNLGKNANMAFGTLVGSGSWAVPKFAMVVPFTAITFGDRKNNINFSGGYGAVWSETENTGKALFSVGGMVTLSKKASLVFDSFFIPASSETSAISFIMPGFRLQTVKDKFFQFGFAGIIAEGEIIPIPMIQLFQRF